MNITKSHLRRIINEEIDKVLLQEAAKGPEDLPEDVFVVIKPDANIKLRTRFFYGTRGRKIRVLGVEQGGLHPSNSPFGGIIIKKSRKGTCDDAWKVQSASADDGWGPLLYDIAMEWATLNGGGLMADRLTVSGEAREVWDYFFNKRSDVIPHQLDNLENELTPNIESDNCNQRTAAWNDWAIDPKDMDMRDRWAESALSKRYTKGPQTMQELESMGKLVEE
jgi:hypothetical protein